MRFFLCSALCILCGSQAATAQSGASSTADEYRQILEEWGRPGADPALNIDASSLAARLLNETSPAAKAALAELYLLGFPQKDGAASSRNPELAVAAAAAGAEAGACGRCFFILGVLLASGDPTASRAAHFQIAADGSIAFEYARGLSSAEHVAGADCTLDRPALAYYVGAELGDPLARLAFANYMVNGLHLGTTGTTGVWWRGSECGQAVPALPRQPRPGDSSVQLQRCQQSLRVLAPAAEEAALNEIPSTDAISDLNFRVEDADEVHRAKKELSDWITARASDGFINDTVVQAAGYLLHGDSDIGAPQNATLARELLGASAALGNTDAAWTSMLLHAQKGNLRELGNYADQLISESQVQQVRKIAAQYFKYRYGLGVSRNATRAGAYLLLAADLGDGNAQQTIAHGYAGLQDPELENVTVPGGPSDSRALHYYSLAAKQGRPVAAVNAAALIAQGRGKQSPGSLEGCRSASKVFREVALSYHPDVLQLHSHAHRSFREHDHVGALLRFALLSEVGAMTAHSNAATLWARQGPDAAVQCWQASGHPSENWMCELHYRRRAAALAGDANAMLWLTNHYTQMHDHDAAYHWAAEAAAAGNTQGMFIVAYSKEQGIGTTKDLCMACARYNEMLYHQDQVFLARALVFFRILRIRVAMGASCCVLPEMSKHHDSDAGAGAFAMSISIVLSILFCVLTLVTLSRRAAP